MSSELQRLQEQENHFRHALEMVKLGYWYWVPLTNELVWSPESFNLMGHDPSSGATPDLPLFMQNIHPDDQAYVQSMLGNALNAEQVPDLQYRVIRNDGIAVLRARAELIPANDSHPAYLFGTVQDVTQEIAQKELLEQASQAKTDFLSSMSHELRTPLNSILGFSQLLEMEDLNASQKDKLREITQAGTHLVSLINDVLDLAEIEAGTLSLDAQWFPLHACINECVSLLRPMTRAKNISLQFNSEISEDDLFQSDPVRLKQILINLMSNAIKYNKNSGQVEITLNAADDGVLLMVGDNGPGISQSQQDKLFTPFERLGHQNSNIPGTGVGLVIVKRIVNNLGGKIWLKSELGKGTQFWVSLPGLVQSQPATKKKPESLQSEPETD